MLAALGLAQLALALTPPPPPPPQLEQALRAAGEHSRQLQISRAQLAEQEAQVEQAIAVLVPNFSFNGSYTRNQYQGSLSFPEFPSNLANFNPASLQFATIVVQPYDQLLGTASLNVPLLGPQALARLAEYRHAAKGGDRSEAATELDVQLATARAYYQITAAQGILAAAERSLATAQDALAVTRAKKEVGTANQLAVDRAQVDVSRALQTRAEAQRTLGVARRSLETLTGLTLADKLPEPEGAAPAEPDAEAELVTHAQDLRPEVTQAREALAQASATRDEAWLQLAPVVTGQAQEHLQNYAGFVGREGYWTLGVNLAWTVDPAGTRAALRKADAGLAEQQARLAQALDTVRDDVHSAWLDVVADGARAKETQGEVQSAREALELTKDQYKAGTATSLDLSQAQRDAFTAEANDAQARSDLATARLALTKASGEPLLR